MDGRISAGHYCQTELRLDLYPYRLKVYEAAHLAVVSSLNFDNKSGLFDQATAEFRDALRPARFLFGADAFNYLESLLTSILQYRHAEARACDDPNYYERENMTSFREKHVSNQKSIFDSLQGLHKELGAYLRVEEGSTTSLRLTKSLIFVDRVVVGAPQTGAR